MPLTDVIQDAIFRPGVRDIANITNAFPALVTTTSDHYYLNGSIVRLYIPPYAGMTQANRLTGAITIINSTSFLIDLNTVYFDAFIAPGALQEPAQVVPIGEETDTLQSSFRNVTMPLF